jgi:hypothetical protein
MVHSGGDEGSHAFLAQAIEAETMREVQDDAGRHGAMRQGHDDHRGGIVDGRHTP